jgi:hypothetical protein
VIKLMSPMCLKHIYYLNEYWAYALGGLSLSLKPSYSCRIGPMTVTHSNERLELFFLLPRHNPSIFNFSLPNAQLSLSHSLTISFPFPLESQHHSSNQSYNKHRNLSRRLDICTTNRRDIRSHTANRCENGSCG